MASSRLAVALAATLVACTHGARGQRGGDDDEAAAPVPVDAAVTDAPIDAEVDAPGPDAAVVRAGPPEWDWWDVRRHSPDLFPSGCKDYCEVWRVAAKVRASFLRDGRTEFLLDRGLADGVTKTMRGRFVDDQGRPFGPLFEHHALGQNKTMAFVMRDVAVTSPYMLLFDLAVEPMPEVAAATK